MATLDGLSVTNHWHRCPSQDILLPGHPIAQRIVYFRDTQTTQATPVEVTTAEGEDITVDMDLPLMEVVVIPFENGVIGDAQINGTTTMEAARMWRHFFLRQRDALWS